MRVSELLSSNGREWNYEKFEGMFIEEIKDKIMEIRLAGRNSKDIYVWEYIKIGYYIVKLGYWV